MPLTPAQQDLVEAHLPLARWVAKRLSRNIRRDNFPDLAQTAAVALCRAAQLWDGRVPFGVYAVKACKHAVRDEMNERLSVVALPRWLFRAEGRGNRCQAHAAQARRVGCLTEANEPGGPGPRLDDRLDAESLLAWLPPGDSALLVANLGGETHRSIARRLGCRSWSVGLAIGRILGKLRDRAEG